MHNGKAGRGGVIHTRFLGYTNIKGVAFIEKVINDNNITCLLVVLMSVLLYMSLKRIWLLRIILALLYKTITGNSARSFD
jgi:hypothetical protein